MAAGSSDAHAAELVTSANEAESSEFMMNAQIRSDGKLSSDVTKCAVPTGAPTDPMAKNFYKFLGPQMDQLEKEVEKQMKVFDDMNKQWEQERNAKWKNEMQSYLPRILRNEGQSHKEVCKRVGGLFSFMNIKEEHAEKPEKPPAAPDLLAGMNVMMEELKKLAPIAPGTAPLEQPTQDRDPFLPAPVEPESDDEFEDESLIPAKLPELSELDLRLLLAHSLSAYMTRLTPEHRLRVYTRVYNDTTHWISSLFRVKDSLALYHDEPEAGLANVCRIALCSRYPDYLERGFDCLYSKPPVIYLSEAGQFHLGNRLCHMLGLPQSCISVVPCLKQEPSQLHKMDVAAFESMVSDHIASTREPLLLVAHASTPQLGQVDPLQKLRTICKAKNIWLHLEGLNLATLCLMSVPTNMLPARTSDSCTLHMAAWFGLAGCPSVTLYRKECKDVAASLNLMRGAEERRLTCFPLWVALQSIGVDGLTATVKSAVAMTKAVIDDFSKVSTISILNNKKPTPKEEVSGFGELIGRVLSTLLVFEMATPVVIFKYGKNREKAEDVTQYAQLSDDTQDLHDAMLARYYDCLNIWFVETVKRECPHVYLEAVDIKDHGTAIKFSPLEHAYYFGLDEGHVTKFLQVAHRQLSIMDATVSHRKMFCEVVKAQDNLRYVEIPGWAGIGAVQYVPTEWLEKLDNLPEVGVNEINKINLELVHKLKVNDAAFSTGRTADNLVCARFGLISEDTDMEDLLGLVYATGKEIEESSRFVEQMAQLVKKGIEEANRDLEKETESRLLSEGVLRQVPWVGSLVNWWSPPPKEMVKGRTFNLSSGKIESTEETYKHRMQILDNQNQPPARQGPLKNLLKPAAVRQLNGTHNRTSSNGSHSSVSSVQLTSADLDSSSISQSEETTNTDVADDKAAIVS